MAYIELSRQNYFHNLELLSTRAGTKEKIAVVLKDNAYGHGLMQMAKLASEFGITKAVVKNHHEAKLIENFFDFILILSPDIKELSDKFSLVINSLDRLSKTPKGAKIHLKIDSGMHRNGIMIEEIEEAFIMIDKCKLQLEGVMTHFRSADELSTELFWQLKTWQEIKQKTLDLVKKYNYNRPLFHSANSAALLRLHHYEDDFARCGISTYGYTEFNPAFNPIKLSPVLELWAEKIATRLVKKGQRIGYGGVGTLMEDKEISTYDIGYGDGIFRYKGVGDFYTKEGIKVLGRVSMDNISLESIDEKVSLFRDAKILASYYDTIVYDVLVKLSPTIKRLII